jgi:catechol 2,3-dioxygenase-like lactoylglutathione lyase family enzyme
MIKGLNHITLSVSDLARSLQFYAEILDFKPKAKWAGGAYLSAGNLWLCLTLDENARRGAQPEYTHLALDIEQQHFASYTQKLLDYGISQWKENSSEGDSLYFLDPDGHKLEIHVGDIESRIESIRNQPYKDLVIF